MPGPRLGVDVGQVRVGVAISDPDGLVATPVATMTRDLSDDALGGRDLHQIAGQVRDHRVAVVYIGLPRHLNGVEGQSGAWARQYAGQLAALIDPVPVRLVDERMSTVSAHRVLREAGRSRRQHRQVVDQAAAVIILQTALEIERGTRQRAGELVAVEAVLTADGQEELSSD